MCECVLVSRVFPEYPLGKNLVFVDIRIFALVEGEKMEYRVILPWIKMRGQIANGILRHSLATLEGEQDFMADFFKIVGTCNLQLPTSIEFVVWAFSLLFNKKEGV